MPDVLDVRPRTRSRSRVLPWLVRVSVGTALLAVIVVNNVARYGLDRDGPWRLGEPMSLMILVAGVVAAGACAVVEGFYARRARRLWLQCVLAAAGAAVIAWVAGIAVGLRFFLSSNPVEQDDVEMALSSFVLMALVYVLIVLLCRSSFRRRPRG